MSRSYIFDQLSRYLACTFLIRRPHDEYSRVSRDPCRVFFSGIVPVLKTNQNIMYYVQIHIFIQAAAIFYLITSFYRFERLNWN